MTLADETVDIYELVNKMRGVQALNETSIAETHVTKRIERESIFLVGYGDLHIENLGTDLDRIETELKIMGKIPNLYVVFMGDLTDSSVKYLNNNFDTYLTPKAAREFGYRIFDALGDKLICALSGCHEKHSEEVADFDYVEEYCKRNHIPFLNERGLLTLELPNERTLNIAVAHKAQGYSMYNPFHPAIRLIREHYSNADVVITAHQHQSGIAIQSEQDKPRAMMTIGTRKQGDRFATRRGFSPQRPNKNLPVLEVLPRGYKILNDITLLEERKGNKENEKLEYLRSLGFKNAVALKKKTLVKANDENIGHEKMSQRYVGMIAPSFSLSPAQKEEQERLNEEIHLRRKMAAEDPLSEDTEKIRERKAKDRERKRKYRKDNKKKNNKYMREYMRKYREAKKKND